MSSSYSLTKSLSVSFILDKMQLLVFDWLLKIRICSGRAFCRNSRSCKRFHSVVEIWLFIKTLWKKKNWMPFGLLERFWQNLSKVSWSYELLFQNFSLWKFSIDLAIFLTALLIANTVLLNFSGHDNHDMIVYWFICWQISVISAKNV